MVIKPVDAITIDDFAANPVWRFVLEHEAACEDETCMTPVQELPVTSLDNTVVGLPVRLNNGTERWVMMGNITLHHPRKTQHFLTVSIAVGDGWFHLARYHDSDYDRSGPAQLAAALELTVDDVFPIAYDISPYAVGDPSVLRGTLPAEPPERLSSDEIMALIFEE